MSISHRILGMALLAALGMPAFHFESPALAQPLPLVDDAPQVEAPPRPLTGFPGQTSTLMDGRDTTWSKYRISETDYFAQPNEWTCGASSYIMAYRALTGEDITLPEAVQRTGAKEGVGADNGLVKRAFEMLGPEFEVITGQTSTSDKNLAADAPERLVERKQEYAELKRLLDEGYLVVLNFREPVDHGGHYGILQGINEQAIEIADPYYGRRSILTLDAFDYRSGYSTPVLHGWYLAVRPKG